VRKYFQLYEISIDNLNNTITDNINTWLGESEIEDANKTIDIINIIKDKNTLENKNTIIDWLIIDHYAINQTWENCLKKYVNKICVIDDFTNRKHNCDILINQQITYEIGKQMYNDIINNNCILYCGNEYLLLNSRYFEYINYKKIYKNNFISRINIFMGGADTYNITKSIIDICIKYNSILENKIFFDVVIGKANKHYHQIKEIILNNNQWFSLYYDIDFIGDLFANSDLAIGGIGTTSYERCIMKTPSLCICLADNQQSVLDKFIDLNVIKYLGSINQNYQDNLIKYLNYFNNNFDELKKMSYNCEKIIDLKNNKINSIL
jgi:UDP-2,4-diacetamido-2,4,6-trideoxy-beta-L-altropyranose hydrolase